MISLREGDADAARELVRAKLSEKAFALIRMPRIEELQDATACLAHRVAAAELEKLKERVVALPTRANVLAFILGHLDALSRRLSTGA